MIHKTLNLIYCRPRKFLMTFLDIIKAFYFQQIRRYFAISTSYQVDTKYAVQFLCNGIADRLVVFNMLILQQQLIG